MPFPRQWGYCYTHSAVMTAKFEGAMPSCSHCEEAKRKALQTIIEAEVARRRGFVAESVTAR